nr:immunoglobulin heavy chain junction region [Macaca mulatta]MOV55280.1 immunoglobulin heavy chain junction region [Macaca mulatta]MOV57469.1 immunoglobulin heavy chain junction region [Macaca mulatta]MOV57671.1 immunoglobulin heavy chain junction region [Macaca mulatta]MOV57835.1 immunoglobulin heavy chain junction region [Macaca mulatta]
CARSDTATVYYGLDSW